MIEIDPFSPRVERGYKRLNGAKVRFPSNPLDIRLYFGAHDHKNQLSDGFEADIAEADIFNLETVGWSPEGAELRRRISEGDQAALDEMEAYLRSFRLQDQAAFERKLLKSLFAKNVRVNYPDVPKGHQYVNEFIEATSAGSQIYFQIMTGQENEITNDSLQKAGKQAFSIFAKREKYILEHFFPSDFQKSGPIKVVGFFGLLHSGISIVLAREAQKQGREDITISANSLHGSKAYEQFLTGMPIGRPELLRFFRTKGEETAVSTLDLAK